MVNSKHQIHYQFDNTGFSNVKRCNSMKDRLEVSHDHEN